MRWGLVPSWWKKPLRDLPSTFNARAETVAEKPMFRSAFKSRRCVIPAPGFYEWTGAKGAKTPHYFSARSPVARLRCAMSREDRIVRARHPRLAVRPSRWDTAFWSRTPMDRTRALRSSGGRIDALYNGARQP
ncbi:SOS response-associated peptidase family protein [Methylocystis sp. H62]|uniref:SOS response-associated peptidase family protein n=1 Tax=Methylocystis sp. H62 TaxID=2785789 RepID=UPI001FEFB6C5|nr:SOS response-associated peptidase family protein [Methylocystis sp. H62]